MYLVLMPTQNAFGHRPAKAYQSFFTDQIDSVAKCIKEEGALAYKLDMLTKVKNVEVTYQEVTEETQDE